MTRSSKCLTEHYRVGRYECDMTVGTENFVVEWSPELTPHCLKDSEVRKYKKYRNRLIKKFFEETGHRHLIIDV